MDMLKGNDGQFEYDHRMQAVHTLMKYYQTQIGLIDLLISARYAGK